MTSKVKLIWATPDAETLIAYMARVSNPSNQNNQQTASKLLKYLVDNKHWSPFEMVNVCMEIETPRDIARQILRHRSFSFQEFSQRYAVATEFDVRECRMQDNKNRQNSLPTQDRELVNLWEKAQEDLIQHALKVYNWGLEQGVAREVARAVLPEGNTMSRMYMNGTLRSWLHYVDIRCDKATQKEHREVADKCKLVLKEICPSLFEENV
jgi:thymidylate synthase (FAD)